MVFVHKCIYSTVSFQNCRVLVCTVAQKSTFAFESNTLQHLAVMDSAVLKQNVEVKAEI